MENNEGKKVIKISLNKFIGIAASIAIVGALGTILCLNRPWENKSKLDIQAEQKDEPKIPEIVLDKEWRKDNMKLKYPSDWELTENETYATPTVLAAPGNNDDEKAKLYITINENTGNITAREIIEVATNPDYGVPTETVDEGEKDIAGAKAYYKTQSMSYDSGSNWKSTTVIFVKDIFMYEFRFTGIEEEYNSYYPVFEKMLDTVEFINSGNKEFISLSIDTANKKIVDEDVDKYNIYQDDSEGLHLSIRNGKIYVTSDLDKKEWSEMGIVPNENDIKISKNYEAEITGFSKRVVDAEISVYGHDMSSIFLIFLMEDGSLEFTGIKNLVTNLTTEGKVGSVSNVQRIYECSIGWKDGGGMSSIIALDSENNMYDIGYILYK